MGTDPMKVFNEIFPPIVEVNVKRFLAINVLPNFLDGCHCSSAMGWFGVLQADTDRAMHEFGLAALIFEGFGGKRMKDFIFADLQNRIADFTVSALVAAPA
jgi:hypothetical protein